MKLEYYTGESPPAVIPPPPTPKPERSPYGPILRPLLAILEDPGLLAPRKVELAVLLIRSFEQMGEPHGCGSKD